MSDQPIYTADELDALWTHKWNAVVDTLAGVIERVQTLEDMLRRGISLQRAHGPDAVNLMAWSLAWKNDARKLLAGTRSRDEGGSDG